MRQVSCTYWEVQLEQDEGLHQLTNSEQMMKRVWELAGRAGSDPVSGHTVSVRLSTDFNVSSETASHLVESGSLTGDRWFADQRKATCLSRNRTGRSIHVVIVLRALID